MKVLLVDDHPATREELAALFDAEDDFTVVGQAASGESGIDLARDLNPRLIVMDIAMPGISGIEAARIVHAHNPDIGILMLTNHVSRELVDAALGAGAGGYVHKNRAYEELIPALRAIADGECYLGRDVVH